MEFEKPKFGTKKWFENYWYHYKWHTIAGLFVLFLAVTFVRDMVTREKFDAEISVNCEAYVTPEQQAAIKAAFDAFAEDCDGDGTINTGVSVNQFPGENGDPQMFMAAQVKFMAELSDGNAMILILDSYTYEQVGDSNFFADLSEYSGEAFDEGRKVHLRNTPLAQYPVLEPLLDNLYLTLRAPDTPAASKNDKAVANYQNELALLKRFLAGAAA